MNARALPGCARSEQAMQNNNLLFATVFSDDVGVGDDTMRRNNSGSTYEYKKIYKIHTRKII